ncbi:hypothetical protein QJS83_03440 [Bdellovibrio sp. 22V]|uniref:hypothetical protein n=1 Tax=Bdellovibrio TaxID=958 RepID=UPI002543B4DA|nr:hypothetical protein [Bdellovibrio sp. 22V]WII72924.1 hypothetical protein QJS83_03440 [Bdellovibrio sp. 22V]
MFLKRVLRLVPMILLSVFFVETVQARACLTDHIRDALKINKERAPHYARLSQGRSAEISKRLISMERKLSFIVPFADAWAIPYHMAGVNILCDDFIDMAYTPKFRSQNPEGADSILNFRRPNVETIKARLFELYKAKDYQGLAYYADHKIHELESVPRYNCMVRHVLESIRRMAALAPLHDQKARHSLGVSSLFLSRTVLRSHILLLDESTLIDTLAAPLQSEGLPIVCQDVPAIPWP